MKPRHFLHAFLFLITLTTTTMAGAEWRYGKSFFFNQQGFTWAGSLTWPEIWGGLPFALSFLGVLTVHEFGHYFTARFYKVRVTLPYYIPMWLGFTSSIGTMGAFIRIKERIFSRKEFFDIGIAGPFAGFVVALPLLWYGFTHLPPAAYIYQIHPEYQFLGSGYANYVYQGMGNLSLGSNLLFYLFEQLVADPALLPNHYEIIHYPYLFAGFLALFFTALNLLPIGQLDGGHILYGMMGYERFNRLSPMLFTGFIFYAGLGLIPLDTDLVEYWWLWGGYVLYLLIVFRPMFPEVRRSLFVAAGVFSAQIAIQLLWPTVTGYHGWLVFGLVLARAMGIFHPHCPDERPLSKGRLLMGWLALVVFLLSFSPEPFIID